MLGLIVLLGGAATVVKLFTRKPPIEAEFVTKAELHAYRKETDREIESLRGKMDRGFERLMEKMDETKTEILTANERRAVDLHNRLNVHQADIARLDERTRPGL